MNPESFLSNFRGSYHNVKGNLNEESTVTSVAGLGALATGVGSMCSFCTGKYGLGTGLLVSAACLGAAYYKFEQRDRKNILADQKHKERIAKIKHPNSPVEGDEEFSQTSMEGMKYDLYKLSETFIGDSTLNPMLGYILPEGYDALIYGKKGSMKSYFVADTMAQIVKGEVPTVLPPDMRDYTVPCNVYGIYADAENGKAVNRQRLSFFGSSLDPHMDILESREFGDDLESFFHVLHEICMNKPSGSKILVGLDNLKSLLNDMSQSQGRDYLNQIKKLRNTLKKKGITLTTITVHHTVKTGDKVSGSYNLPCLIPYVFRIELGKDKAHKNWVIENTRTGDNKDSVYALKVIKEDYTHLVYDYTLNNTSVDATSKEEEKRQKYEQVKAMRESDPPVKWDEIKAITGVSSQCYNGWKKCFAK